MQELTFRREEIPANRYAGSSAAKGVRKKYNLSGGGKAAVRSARRERRYRAVNGECATTPASHRGILYKRRSVYRPLTPSPVASVHPFSPALRGVAAARG